jgi:hypothetical protein
MQPKKIVHGSKATSQLEDIICIKILLVLSSEPCHARQRRIRRYLEGESDAAYSSWSGNFHQNPQKWQGRLERQLLDTVVEIAVARFLIGCVGDGRLLFTATALS